MTLPARAEPPGTSDPTPLPRVSVLIPVFNAERYLRACIESVLTQTFRDFEILAIDDASADRSLQVLESFDDPRLRLIRNTRNLGQPGTRNRGITLARGEYIALLDADDACEPHRLATQVAYLDHNPQLAAVGSFANVIDDDGSVMHVLEVPTCPQEIRQRMFSHNCFVHPSVMARRHALIEVGGYDDRYRAAQDYDLFLRLLDHHALANLAEPLVRYRIHAGQISHRSLRLQRRLADRARQEAYRRQLRLGTLPAATPPPEVGLWRTLRGLPGTFGSDCRERIRTYRSMNREAPARGLAWTLPLRAPLAGYAWRELSENLIGLALTRRQRSILSWYLRRMVRALTRRTHD